MTNEFDAIEVWTKFGDKLPNIGDQVRIKFDDGTEFPHNYGTIQSIRNIKELGPDDIVVMTDNIGESWTMKSDKYSGSVMKDRYLWRISYE